MIKHFVPSQFAGGRCLSPRITSSNRRHSRPDLPAAYASVIQADGYRVTGPTGPWCEIWLRKTIPAGAKPSDRQHRPSHRPRHAARRHAISRRPAPTGAASRSSPGVYTLRYSNFPVDGAHQGVAPQRDFALLTPIANDADPSSHPGFREARGQSKTSGNAHADGLLARTAPGLEVPRRHQRRRARIVLTSKVASLPHRDHRRRPSAEARPPDHTKTRPRRVQTVADLGGPRVGLVQDIRYGFRLLAKKPGFTAAAVACLALGIGATTAIFSVVNAVLLRPLPYTQSGRLVRIFTEFPNFPNGGLRHFWVSPPEFLDLRRDTSPSRPSKAGSTGRQPRRRQRTRPCHGVATSRGGMLPMLGVSPMLGRLLIREDDTPNVPLTAVLSYGLWQRAFGGDRGIIGRDIRLERQCLHRGRRDAAGLRLSPGRTRPARTVAPRADRSRRARRPRQPLSYLVWAACATVSPTGRREAEMMRYEHVSTDKLGATRHPFNHRTTRSSSPASRTKWSRACAAPCWCCSARWSSFC